MHFCKGRPVRDALARMDDAIALRGPDDTGEYIDPQWPVALIHRRLSVIDLSGAARCPMCDSTKSTVLVYNGKIYNFPKIRAELETKGYVFRSRSDTEVILHGYREWGIKIVDRLDGMFAFAIWDRERRVLWLARDRFGEKPLYCGAHGGIFSFSSGIAATLAGLRSTAEISPAALGQYLKDGYIAPPKTIWKPVKALEPGCIAKVELSGAMTIEPY